MSPETIHIDTDAVASIDEQLDAQKGKLERVVARARGGVPESETTGQFRFSRLAGVRPDVSTFTVSGALSSHEHEFDVGYELVVMLTTPDGQIVCSAPVEVVTASATRKRDAEGFVVSTERGHKLKVG